MKILLTDWAAKHYSPPPSIFTLRRWAKAGEIYPPPEKAGKSYYVDENAQRISVDPGRPTLLQQLQSA